MNNLLLLKLEVIMELWRRGGISVDEFRRLIIEKIRKVCPDTQGEVGSYLLYFLDVIDFRNDKVVLSRDGGHYIEVIRVLQGVS